MNAKLVAFCATLLVALEASAFVCSRTDETSGPSLSWTPREVVYTFFDGGTSDIDGLEEFDAIRDAFAVWENLVTAPTDSCIPAGASTDFRWTENPVRSDVDRVGFNFIDEGDNENLIIFRDDAWPYPGRETRDLALATVTFNRVTGEILDSDMEFNTANTQFTVRDVQPVTDLLNTAVHEVGHLMGLAHTPNSDASMFGSAAPGEIKKRDLNCDDRTAIAFKYPNGGTNGYCTGAVDDTCGGCEPPGTVETNIIATEIASGEDVGGGCRSIPAASVWWAVAAFVALMRRPLNRRLS